MISIDASDWLSWQVLQLLRSYNYAL